MQHLTGNTTRRDFLASLAALSVPGLCTGLPADTSGPASRATQIIAAIEKIQRGVPGMQDKCSYTPIENPTHLVVVLRQTHGFAPTEALFKTAPPANGRTLLSEPNLDGLRRELLQAATFLRQNVSLKDIFCEAVSADQLPELEKVVAELRTSPSSRRRGELKETLGEDLSKCELVAQSGLTLHAGESRELNRVVSELNEKGLLLVKEFQNMGEIKARLERQYRRHEDIPQDQQQLFIAAADRATKSSEKFVAFWNNPETQQKIFEKRELFALEQVCHLLSSRQPSDATNNSSPGAVLLYGGNHDFRRHLTAIHSIYPHLRIAFMELTPKSYRDSVIKR